MSTGSLATVVAQHYNQIEEKGRAERSKSRIFHLRNFNNWIKSMLMSDIIQKFNSENDKSHKKFALDIGAGKGGDLMKWKKNGIDYLVCADIAETSVQQCQQRYIDMKERHIRQKERGACYAAEFIVADCTKDRLKDKYKDPDIQFDFVSCQFAFHYSFESYAQAKAMIQNVSESLKCGGYFIGTLPDAYDIMRRLEESSACSFGNDVYCVKFSSKNKEDMPLFGTTYDFHLEGVVNCPEFLVYFPAFVKLAKDFGNLELVYSYRFDKFYEKFSKTSDGQQLLARMQALETYPPPDGAKLMAGDDEYYHAEKKLESLVSEKKDSEETEICVGTLSKSEWEIACMYLVFAFKKVESSKTEP